MTLKHNPPNIDFYIGVTFALSQNAILCNQILCLQQMDPQHPLQDNDRKMVSSRITASEYLNDIKHLLLVNSLGSFGRLVFISN